MAQFVCKICGEGFEQRSGFERHMAASHPPTVPSAADVEKALAATDFPQGKNGLVERVRENAPTDERLLELVQRLPDHRYRDAAEVAVALGDLKSPQPARSDEPSGSSPGRRGGKAAAGGASAAGVARILGGVTFPMSKRELVEYAQKHGKVVDRPEALVALLDELPDREYGSMADVEESIGLIS